MVLLVELLEAGEIPNGIHSVIPVAIRDVISGEIPGGILGGLTDGIPDAISVDFLINFWWLLVDFLEQLEMLVEFLMVSLVELIVKSLVNLLVEYLVELLVEFFVELLVFDGIPCGIPD